ncbi:25346_t:CDS:2 [Dentiscutata erythropus]|uniref:25346_t:CDS:1 n=1 Tax=Dentiscutata erythropus TaxID=1348616 RepID=A0A9N9NND5_9GLOM|nr:25346_t:CDS:2 [Dentiscutata erythropus]
MINKEKQINYKRSIFNQYKNYDELDINEVATILLDQYKIIGGRKFLDVPEANYLMPSDEMELRRIEIAHVLKRYAWKGNFNAPVEDMLKNGKADVLDAGHSIKCLPNTGFLEYNLIRGIPFPDETFDYVHVSSMWSAFTKQQYINVIHELVRVTKYNGWIEIFESNMDYKNLGNSMKGVQDARKFTQISVHTKLKENGIVPKIFLEISKCIRSINELTNIEHRKLNVLEAIQQFYESATYMADYMGISQSDYQKLIEDFDNQCNQNRTYLETHRFFAKKVKISETQ